jgi:hypothetical protein
VHVTSNRAQKQAARRRAAETGEPYVVARRHLDDPSGDIVVSPEKPYPWVVKALHDLTHRVPGVPRHTDAATIRAEHEARHRARAAKVKARHEAWHAKARTRHS